MSEHNLYKFNYLVDIVPISTEKNGTVDNFKFIYNDLILAQLMKKVSDECVYNDIEVLERPNTEEFKKHDEYFNKMLEEYDRIHPKPKLKCESSLLHNKEYRLWIKLRNEYKEEIENKYKEEHPEYLIQAEEYKKELVKSWNLS